MITRESLEKGKAAALAGKPLDEVQAVYTNGTSRVVKTVKANETSASKMFRLASATVRAFAKDFPKETLEIVRQEILDKRKETC